MSLDMAAIFHMPFLFTDESLSGERSDSPACSLGMRYGMEKEKSGMS